MLDTVFDREIISAELKGLVNPNVKYEFTMEAMIEELKANDFFHTINIFGNSFVLPSDLCEPIDEETSRGAQQDGRLIFPMAGYEEYAESWVFPSALGLHGYLQMKFPAPKSPARYVYHLAPDGVLTIFIRRTSIVEPCKRFIIDDETEYQVSSEPHEVIATRAELTVRIPPVPQQATAHIHVETLTSPLSNQFEVNWQWSQPFGTVALDTTIPVKVKGWTDKRFYRRLPLASLLLSSKKEEDFNQSWLEHGRHIHPDDRLDHQAAVTVARKTNSVFSERVAMCVMSFL